MIDFVCLLYLWRNRASTPAWRLGFVLGIAASACAYFHLQFGGMATALLFMFTAVTLGFEQRINLKQPFLAGPMGLAVVLLIACPHYLYYFSKSDFVADADSLLYMFAPINGSFKILDHPCLGIPYLDISACSSGLVVHGQDPDFQCGQVFRFFRRVHHPHRARPGRGAAPECFGPVFLCLPLQQSFTNTHSRATSKWPDERIRWTGIAASLVILPDIYPLTFQLPYRSGSGDRPVAEALTAIGPSRGRIIVSSPDRASAFATSFSASKTRRPSYADCELPACVADRAVHLRSFRPRL